MRQATAAYLTEESDGGETVKVNAVKAVLRPKPRKNAVTFAQECSHLLTGYEQWAIRRVCPEVRGLVGIVYDGLIAPPQPTEGWSAHIEAESARDLRVTLRLSFKATEFTPWGT
jgi:hypothetical protein